MVAAVWAGSPWLSLLAAVLASLGVLEFYRMAERREARPAVALGIVWTLAFIVSGDREDYVSYQTPFVAMGGAALTFSWLQMRRLPALRLPTRAGVASGGFRDSLVDWAYTAAGAFYVGWTLSLFLLLRAEPNGLQWALVVILGTFATDTGAFFTGKAVGRIPLAPRISPGKTWEGAVGGFLAGTGAVMALAYWQDLPLSAWQAPVLGALVGVSAQAGDLVESMIKRASGVKDAGGIIPGHGGVLDRLDSVVFVIVVVYHFLVWIVK